jgi:hypothetical protein
MTETYEAEVIQDGMAVAGVSGSDLPTVHREAMHYWAQYQQDGPTYIRWKGMSPEQYETLKRYLAGDDAPTAETT